MFCSSVVVVVVVVVPTATQAVVVALAEYFKQPYIWQPTRLSQSALVALLAPMVLLRILGRRRGR